MTQAIHTFETFLQDALIKSLPELTLEASQSPAKSVLKARLGFEGAGMKAQTLLMGSKEFLQATCPLPTEAQGHSEAAIKDWLGELGNLILGRLKNRLLAHDITIKISPPSFDGKWAKSAGAKSIEIWLKSEHGLIGLECSIEGTLPKIGDAIKQTAEILPGDAIYRLNDPVNTPPSYDIISKIRSGESNGEGASHERDELETLGEVEDDFGDDRKHEVFANPKIDTKPIRILYHSGAKTPVLTGVSWTMVDKLLLTFSSGVEYTLCPKTLLEKGSSSFVVEDLVVCFNKESDLIRVSIPKLNMHLSKLSQVA